MRAALVKEVPWKENLEGLPMKKEMEALDRLPGNYTVTASSKKIIKAGGGVLSRKETKFVETSLLYNLERGSKIAISKEMCGDPLVLWRIIFGTESKKVGISIYAQPLQHKFGLGRGGKIDTQIKSLIGGGKVEKQGKETCFTGEVETERRDRFKGYVAHRSSASWEVDSKGKLEGTWKKWKHFSPAGAVELIITWEAQRD